MGFGYPIGSRRTTSYFGPNGRFVAFFLATILCMLTAIAFAGAAAAATGGTGFQVRPVIKKIACVKDCTGKKGARVARGGSTIRIVGDDLNAATKIVFLGSRGPADDATAGFIAVTKKVATVKIPGDSASGRIVAVTSSGTQSMPSPYITILPQPPVVGSPDLKPVATGDTAIKLESGTSTPRKVFLGAKELVRYSLKLDGIDNAKVNIALTRLATGEVAASWTIPAPNGQVVSVDWDGLSKGATAPPGRYAFTVAINTDLAVASGLKRSSIVESRDAFDLLGYMFPVRGKVTFGAGLGDGRGHQGHDLMARCGTKLVAARGGTVVESRRQGAAGNFIAIRPDTAGIGDQVYMHMERRSPFRKGDRVYTGQQIGTVGSTGRSSACHLHFEQWTGEVWRSRPVEMMAELRAWARVS